MERLILTYLVVLPHRTWMHRWAADGRICIEHIGAIEKVQGNNLFPPGRMERDDVLAHALDHLALLSRDDSSIHAVLAPEWMDVLDMRLPRPAGLVQFVPSGSLRLQDLAAEGTGLDKLRRSEEAWLSMGGLRSSTPVMQVPV
jgi:hypothetical protein